MLKQTLGVIFVVMLCQFIIYVLMEIGNVKAGAIARTGLPHYPEVNP